MSERLADAPKRQEFSTAVRRAAWARCAGRCEGCGLPLTKGGFTYDHTIPWRRGGPSTLDNCRVLCSGPKDSCDWEKTYTKDLPGIAAVKRYGKNRLPLDIDRPAKLEPKMQSRNTFPKQSRPMRSRLRPKAKNGRTGND